MADSKAVKELMIDVFEYPHMPYWFTIRQAIGIMKKTVIEAQKCVHPQVILVFDEKYILIGTLSVRDLLRGLTPGILTPESEVRRIEACADEGVLAGLEANLCSAESKKLLEKPISEIMEPVNSSVSPEDSMIKAACLMESRNIQVLPVLENKKKLVGIVRMMEVFQTITGMVLEK